MAQTPAKRITSRGESIDYTPGSAVTAGDVVEIGSIPMIACQDIAASALGALACEGVFDVPKTSDAFTAGDAVYWNSTGNPVSGTAATGAADSATGNLMGVAIADAASGAYYVRTKLTAAKRTTTIGGAVTASDITGEDSSLAISGINAAQGGAIAAQGGTSSTSANAGGAITATGGTGGATGNGGAVTITGGTPGATSGTGGAVSMTGGGSAAGTNYTGGASSVVGGAGKGSGNGGAVAVTGGAGGTTGTGGAISITSGASAGASGTAGAVSIDCGAATGGTAGAITIGGTNAGSITMGKMPRIPCATVAAAGAAQGNAAAVAEGFTLVTAADATKGVVLPAAAAGKVCIIKNRDSDNAVLKVYPNTADAINALSANASLDIAAKTSVILVAYDATTWYSIPLLPS